MSRLPAALLLLAPTVAVAAPAPKGRAPEFYFPTTEGARRVYETRQGDSTTEHTEVVTRVERKDGAFRVTVGQPVEGEVRVTGTLEVSAKGVFRVANAAGELPAPVPLVKPSARPGDTWTWEREGPAGFGPVTTKYTAGPEEEVTVPAGKFRARRVEQETELKGRVTKYTQWYAPGVGLVKSVGTSGGPERTQVLKSFTPGK